MYESLSTIDYSNLIFMCLPEITHIDTHTHKHKLMEEKHLHQQKQLTGNISKLNFNPLNSSVFRRL